VVIQTVRRLLSRESGADGVSDPRSAQRHRNAILAAITGVFARITGMSVSLVTVPVTFHYLGKERFGLWMTISSVIVLANFADFGIGNGVVNSVAEASGRDDLQGIRSAISSGFSVLSAIGLGLGSMFFVAAHFVSWGDVFRVSSEGARAEVGPAVMGAAICFALNIPLDIVQRVQLGLQQGFQTNCWQIFSSVMSLTGVLAVVHLRGGVPQLVIALAGAPAAGAALNAIYFFCIQRRDLLPRWSAVSKATVKKIANLGGMFFVIQVVIAISFSTDNVIIARTLGVGSVALYSIPQRMFSLITVMLFTLVTPLWPAYGEAMARGDLPWIKRTLSVTLAGVLIVACSVATVLVVFSNQILRIWVGNSLHPEFMLVLGLGVWEIVRSFTGTMQMFLNGANILRFQTITHCIFGVFCLTSKILCAKHFGTAGVPWAATLTYSIFIIVPNLWYLPRLFKSLEAVATAEAVLADPA